MDKHELSMDLWKQYKQGTITNEEFYSEIAKLMPDDTPKEINDFFDNFGGKVVQRGCPVEPF